MATGFEIRTSQKSILFDLLKAKKGEGNLDDIIKKMKASMEAEDFAYVEKIINEDK